MDDQRTAVFINSLDKGIEPFLEEVYKEAVSSFVPVIRKETQSFLKTILKIKKPSRILEVGTAIGFSAMLMAQNTGAECRITTIENYAKRIPTARENFRKYGFADRIELIEGDAAEILKTLDGPFDLIFMDAAKGQYIYYLDDVKRLLEKGGILISDNVLQGGEVLESHYIVERRDRTIHKRMREYLYALKHDEQLETSVIPLGDGVTLSVKL